MVEKAPVSAPPIAKKAAGAGKALGSTA